MKKIKKKKQLKEISKLLLFILTIFFIFTNTLKVYADDELSVNAKAAIIVEANTGKIIYEQNATDKNYPASVTKILTAIIVIENCNLDDVATVSEYAISQVPIEYIVAPLRVGEQMRIEDLLYALMLKSANDAAYVLAEHVGGSVEGFADLMNKKAQEIGCQNSHFVNPNGIHNENHYTTAYDMYLISNYAMKNEIFAKIVSTYKHTLPATNKYYSNDRVMENTNLFVVPTSSFYNKYVKGIKTGTTVLAGNCLITDAEKDGLEFITVVLGAETSNSKFSETKKMIDYSFNHYAITKLREKGDIIKTIEIENATEETKNLNLVISNEINVFSNIKINLDEIKPEINLNKNISAPITVGQELGIVKFNVDGLEYTAKLLAENNVQKKTFEKEVISIIGGIVLFDILLVIIIKIKKRKQSKK